MSASEEVIVLCEKCSARCPYKVAGEQSKNPGKAFYSCPNSWGSGKTCEGFFVWEDEVGRAPKRQRTSQSSGWVDQPVHELVNHGGRVSADHAEDVQQAVEVNSDKFLEKLDQMQSSLAGIQSVLSEMIPLFLASRQ
jgi:hypothetical protein